MQRQLRWRKGGEVRAVGTRFGTCSWASTGTRGDPHVDPSRACGNATKVRNLRIKWLSLVLRTSVQRGPPCTGRPAKEPPMLASLPQKRKGVRLATAAWAMPPTAQSRAMCAHRRGWACTFFSAATRQERSRCEDLPQASPRAQLRIWRAQQSFGRRASHGRPAQLCRGKRATKLRHGT